MIDFSWPLRRLGDLLDHRIGLGVHGGGIERVLAVHDAQEARRLLERLGAEARHLLERVRVLKAPFSSR